MLESGEAVVINHDAIENSLNARIRPVVSRGDSALTARQTRGRILIVDDDRGFVLATALMLESAGYQVIAAFDTESALQKIAQHNPDLLLLDVRMRDGGGFVIQERVHFDPLLERPAVFITGDQSNWINYFSQAMGGRAVVRKPFRKLELLRTIASIIG